MPEGENGGLLTVGVVEALEERIKATRKEARELSRRGGKIEAEIKARILGVSGENVDKD